MILRKINDTHYVVTNGRPTNDGEYAVHPTTLNISQHHSIDSNLSRSWEKIEYSTKPLEEDITYRGITSKPVFEYFQIKPLSLPEVEELTKGYSAEKMANDKFPDESTAGWKDSFSPRERRGFIEGVKTVEEILKDKVFSIEDMRKAIEMAKEGSIGYYAPDSPNYYFGYSENDIIQSLLPLAEWNVTIDENDKITLL